MANQQLDLPITGMTCASCVMRVEKALRKTPGVLVATVNLATERASVTFAPGVADRATLTAAVARKHNICRPRPISSLLPRLANLASAAPRVRSIHQHC